MTRISLTSFLDTLFSAIALGCMAIGRDLQTFTDQAEVTGAGMTDIIRRQAVRHSGYPNTASDMP
jgi:hypothetical protein